MEQALSELDRAVRAALETYSNVHRGSGHHSLVSTRLYERARDVVLEYLGLDRKRHEVVFCTPRRAELLAARLAPGTYHTVSSQEVGLPFGVRALAVARKVLPGGAPFETGGGTARLVSPGWVVWARTPDKFEAGTPAIVNVIAFAKALRLTRKHGRDALRADSPRQRTATDLLHRDALEGLSGRQLLVALRNTLLGSDVQVPTVEGSRSYVNLDNAASTPTFEPIWETVRLAWREPPPVQREIAREVASICASALGAPAAEYDLVFTSNTSEAVNLAAESLRRESEPGTEPVVVNTLLEHNSNELPWRSAGLSLVRLPVSREGFVDTRELEGLLRAHNEEGRHGSSRVKLVTVSGASNVLGVFNDLAEISRIVHRHGARLLVDAAQLVAHRKVEMAACGIDYLAFSGHKVYAPFGTGALLFRRGLLRFDPAELERIRASGEENVGGVAALGKALLLLQRIGFDVIEREERFLTERALRGLAQVPGLTVHGIKDVESLAFERRGGVIAFSLKGLMPDRIARALAERGGIGVRYGCHCAHMLVKHMLHVPPLLESFQRVIVTVLPRIELPGVARASLGLENTEADVDRLIETLRDISSRNGKGRVAPKEVRRRLSESAKAAIERVYGRGSLATAP